MNATISGTDSTTHVTWVNVDTEGVHSDDAEEQAIELALDHWGADSEYSWVEPTDDGYTVTREW